MQRTRRAILDHLKRHPGATVEELAIAARVAPITVRAHLAALGGGALLRSEDVRGARGRPFRRYFLTEAAEAHFPKHYDVLATSLLEGLEEIESSGSVRALVSHVASGTASRYRRRVDGKSLRERVEVIAEIIEEQGGAAEWEQAGQSYVIREHNCPYLSVSRCSDHVCEMDRQVVEKLAGVDVRVTQRLRDGAESCDFVISGELIAS
jgi:predicted ArsR family transcriptional regulator